MTTSSVPQYIEMCTLWLRDKSLASQPAQPYSAKNWLDAFSSPALQSVLGLYPKSITRLNVADLGKNVHQLGVDRMSLECFFWGVMLWGWANVGNGPERVSRIFRVADPFNQLAEAFRWVQKSEIGSAYQVLRNKNAPTIKNLDEAYFTKFLYFAGLGCELERYPLILDKKVATGLQSLLADNAPKEHRCEDYLVYMALMHDWANTLGCRADSIEYLLYTVPAEFWRK